jgi:heat-inducible transcriptional repressor
MLTRRRRKILTAVVDHYVQAARPVGSRVLAERYISDVSPATIRADLGALEDERLLFQPHTSAGRLPTQAGYRRVVDDLLACPNLSGEGAAYPSQTVSMALRSALSTGMSTGMSAALSTEVSVGASAQAGMTRNPAAANLAGTCAETLARNAAQVLASLNQCLAVVTLMRAGLSTAAQLYYSGLAGLFSQPEFTHPQASQRFLYLLQLLDDERQALMLFDDLAAEGMVSVYIGHESEREGLSEASIVMSRYRGQRQRSFGVVALIGPTRMPYARAISAVATAADTLAQCLH